MQIRVEVFGTLRGKLPGDDGSGKGTFELPDRSTIGEAFARLGIPAEVRYIVMVNGKQQRDREHRLEDGDTLTVLPPVAGGCVFDGP